MITKRERLDGQPEKAPPERAPPEKAPQRPVSVAELVASVRDCLEGAFRFPVLVQGEVSNVRRPRGGHLYFTLRDRRAQLRVVVFSRDVEGLPFPVEDGAKVVARGLVTAFALAGELQLRADWVEPQGIGERAVRIEALRRRLEGEGLLDARRKRPLPFLPRTIGVVTSPTGAAIRDVLTTLERRCPRVRVVLSPVRVSGEAAAPAIAHAIALLDRSLACDVILVARGGGSREELQPFDEEPVCRAIAACRAPVVTGIGHETDTSLADLVADLRAATPTAAAELAVPDVRRLVADLDLRERRLRDALRSRVTLARRRLEACEEERFGRAVAAALERRRALVATGAGRLESLSPLKVLARGYSLTRRGSEVVRDAATLAPGDEIETRLARGRVVSKVVSSHDQV